MTPFPPCEKCKFVTVCSLKHRKEAAKKVAFGIWCVGFEEYENYALSEAGSS